MATFRRYDNFNIDNTKYDNNYSEKYLEMTFSEYNVNVDLCKNYIEKKYGISKYIFNQIDWHKNIRQRDVILNPEYIKVIKNYLLERKLRNKLPIKNIKTKNKKI